MAWSLFCLVGRSGACGGHGGVDGVVPARDVGSRFGGGDDVTHLTDDFATSSWMPRSDNLARKR